MAFGNADLYFLWLKTRLTFLEFDELTISFSSVLSVVEILMKTINRMLLNVNQNCVFFTISLKNKSFNRLHQLFCAFSSEINLGSTQVCFVKFEVLQIFNFKFVMTPVRKKIGTILNQLNLEILGYGKGLQISVF